MPIARQLQASTDDVAMPLINADDMKYSTMPSIVQREAISDNDATAIPGGEDTDTITDFR